MRCVGGPADGRMLEGGIDGARVVVPVAPPPRIYGPDEDIPLEWGPDGYLRVKREPFGAAVYERGEVDGEAVWLFHGTEV